MVRGQRNGGSRGRRRASLHARHRSRCERARGAALAAARPRRRLPLRRRRRRRAGARRGARGGSRRAARGNRRRPRLGAARGRRGSAPLPRLAGAVRPLPRVHRGPLAVAGRRVGPATGPRRGRRRGGLRAGARARHAQGGSRSPRVRPAGPRWTSARQIRALSRRAARLERPRGAPLADDREPPRFRHRANSGTERGRELARAACAPARSDRAADPDARLRGAAPAGAAARRPAHRRRLPRLSRAQRGDRARPRRARPRGAAPLRSPRQDRRRLRHRALTRASPSSRSSAPASRSTGRH